MIVSASYRTDIPAFYADWFRARLRAGYARVRNPYGGPPSTVPLTAEQVQGFVFWTRNAEPFRPALADVGAMGVPFVVHLTVTDYPRPLDAATIPASRAVAQIRELAECYGPASVVWRYDPIIATSLTPPQWHGDTFARLADALAGAVDEVVVSWAQIYRKTARSLTAAARAHSFDWVDPLTERKRALLAELVSIAAERGLTFSLCAQADLRVAGVAEARCVDAERLGRIAGRTIDVARKPHRDGCGCWSSRDIGAYDSCPHGCTYCYAVTNRSIAKRRLQAHDPAGAFLVDGEAEA
jgi:Domain of unknown function (DUF1848).